MTAAPNQKQQQHYDQQGKKEEKLDDEAVVDVYVMCRRGVFSREAAKQLQHMLFGSEGRVEKREETEELEGKTERETEQQRAVQLLRTRVRSVINVQGGYEAWRQHVDPKFPSY